MAKKQSKTRAPLFLVRTKRGSGRNDTLVSGDMLEHAVAAILRRVRLDRTCDIPYLAGYSRNRKVIYIDRHIARFIDHARPAHRHRPLPDPARGRREIAAG